MQRTTIVYYELFQGGLGDGLMCVERSALTPLELYNWVLNAPSDAARVAYAITPVGKFLAGRSHHEGDLRFAPNADCAYPRRWRYTWRSEARQHGLKRGTLRAQEADG